MATAVLESINEACGCKHFLNRATLRPRRSARQAGAKVFDADGPAMIGPGVQL